MQRSTWGEATKTSGREKLPFAPAFEITEKTPKNQLYTIETWNKMRELLLLLGEMEEK